MADWAKIAIKTALIIGIMAGIFAIFANIQIPVIDYSTPSGRFKPILVIRVTSPKAL